jgi:ribosomal protein S27E
MNAYMYIQHMRRNRKSQEQFLEEASCIHGTRFDYSMVEYKNNRTPVKIKCNECQTIFSSNPYNFLKCKNCPTCSTVVQRKTTDDFIVLAKSVHGNNYDYSQTSYVNAKTKVNIKCNVCGNLFKQLPRGHLYEKSGCPTCRQSHGEEKIFLLLKILNVRFVREHKFNDCIGAQKVPLRFDFYLPDFNMCIEYDGKQHFDKSSKYWTPTVEMNDNIKTKYCKTNKVKLKRIPFTEINKIENIVKSLLLS